MPKTKICHMTNLHRSNDGRIFLKECSSLAKAGYDVYLVAQGESREENGVHVVGVGEQPKGRFKRFTRFARKVYERALELDCEIYHLHDPCLLPYGLKLKKAGKKVIFDSHEYVTEQIKAKDYIPEFLRNFLSSVYRSYETQAVKKFDGVVVVNPFHKTLFEGRAKRIVDINNYPRLEDITFHDKDFKTCDAIICYIGRVSEARGEKIMKEAVKGIDATLILAGPCGNPEDHSQENVKYTGLLDIKGVNEVLGKSLIGLCVLKPDPNYLGGHDSKYTVTQATKIYEYMAAGIPFIMSDFTQSKKFAEDTKAGIVVNPLDVQAVHDAILTLLNNREMAQQMGRNGRKAVEENYSWESEAKKLVEFYKAIESA